MEGHVHLNGRECLLKYSISLDSMLPGTTEVSHKDNENHNDFSIHSYILKNSNTAGHVSWAITSSC